MFLIQSVSISDYYINKSDEVRFFEVKIKLQKNIGKKYISGFHKFIGVSKSIKSTLKTNNSIDGAQTFARRNTARMELFFVVNGTAIDIREYRDCSLAQPACLVLVE